MDDSQESREGDGQSGASDGYLTFADAPWLKIDYERIERIDYPPLEMLCEPSEPFLFIGQRAMCVVLKGGGELWSAGDRSWRELERRKKIDAARLKLIEAEREYGEALGRSSCG